MFLILLRCLFSFVLLPPTAMIHPFFVTVTEIEHNAKAQTLEISVKIFSDDFEETLRNNYKTKIDILDKSENKNNSKYISDYISKHLNIYINGELKKIEFLGYEQDEEAVRSYFVCKGISKINSIEILNNLLYDYKEEQSGIVHVIVNGKRKSARLVNPENKIIMRF